MAVSPALGSSQPASSTTTDVRMGNWATYSRRQGQPAGAFMSAQGFLYFLTSGTSYNAYLQPPSVYHAYRVCLTRTGIVHQVNLIANRVLSPPGNVVIWCASDATGLPGAQIGPRIESLAASLPSSQQNVYWTGPGVPITAGVLFWLVVGCPLATATNFVRVTVRAAPLIPGALSATSPDGINWTAGVAGRSWNLRCIGQPAATNP